MRRGEEEGGYLPQVLILGFSGSYERLPSLPEMSAAGKETKKNC